MTFWPVGIDEEWHERLKQRLMERVRLRRRAAHAEAEGGDVMATDPPAPDLGAIRTNLDVFLGQLVTWREMETGWIRTLLAAYDAQAARLAALEQVVGRMQTRLECSSDPYSREHAAWFEAAVVGAVEAGEATDGE